MTKPSILVVDDDEAIRLLLQEILDAEGYDVTTVAEGPAAISAVKDTLVHIVLVDQKLPGIDGSEVMRQILQIDPKVVTIMMTGYGTIKGAVEAMQAGAFDFLTKPFESDAVLVVIKKALEYQRLREENHLLRRAVRDRYRVEHLIGTSDAMRLTLEFIDRVADCDSTVLIHGESGTGKELIARLLHSNSFRRDRPLVPVNCAAIPDTLLESELFGHEKGAFTGAMYTRMGRFEMAHGGTILLDEVGEMPLPLQVKLLRVLQERCFERVGGTKTISVDIRIIAATNQDLEKAVQAGRFRSDLYYRLNVIPFMVPPLRERRSDIPLLIDHFIQRFKKTKRTAVGGIAPDALSHLMRYDWPGNIRELENVVERMVVLKKAGHIETADLPEKILEGVIPPRQDAPPVTFSEMGINLVKELEQYENQLILFALRQAHGVTSKAAQLLRLNRTTLVEKLKRKGLDAKLQSSGADV